MEVFDYVIDIIFFRLRDTPVLFTIRFLFRYYVVNRRVPYVATGCSCVGLTRLCFVCDGGYAKLWHQDYYVNRKSVRNDVFRDGYGMFVAAYDPIETVWIWYQL